MPRKFTLPRSRADKYRLYEWAVQEPEFEVEFAIEQYRHRRGRRPHVLREDFCGTAAVACRWVAEHRKNHAIGLDLDAPTLEWARKHNVSTLGAAAARLDLRQKDVRSVTRPLADVVQAFNFSSYLFHPASELVGYLRCVRRSLAPGGIVMLDGYGGWESQQQLSERRTVKSPAGRFGYTWEQASYNPIDSLTRCHIHFELKNGKKMKRAFTYHWRLYAPAELSDALRAAGYTNIEVLWDFDDDVDCSDFKPTAKAENSPGWLFYVVADRSA